MVPRIVWPEWYVWSGLSKIILNFSFVSPIEVANESDCSDVAGDDDAMDAVVVVIEECDWSALGSPFTPIDDRFSLELWLIFGC